MTLKEGQLVAAARCCDRSKRQVVRRGVVEMRADAALVMFVLEEESVDRSWRAAAFESQSFTSLSLLRFPCHSSILITFNLNQPSHTHTPLSSLFHIHHTHEEDHNTHWDVTAPPSVSIDHD
jgi:hypothetical protein